MNKKRKKKKRRKFHNRKDTRPKEVSDWERE
jgi:hypothetical protein